MRRYVCFQQLLHHYLLWASWVCVASFEVSIDARTQTIEEHKSVDGGEKEPRLGLEVPDSPVQVHDDIQKDEKVDSCYLNSGDSGPSFRHFFRSVCC